PQAWWLTVLVAMVANWALMRAFAPEPSYVNIPYTLFKEQVQAGNVEEVTSQGDAIQGTFKKEVTYPHEGPTKHTALRFKTLLPAFANPGLETLLEQKGVVITARPLDEARPLWQNLVFGFGPTLLLIVGFVWMNQRMMARGRGLFGLGRSGAKRYSDAGPKVTFDDVAGIDDAENELVEVVDFLKNPAKYQRLGGTVPKGVLLIGAPGTGKTLLARAVAGQAGVPFFSLSAAEFVEMIVGVGAARVRDLFKQAPEAAPSTIFIDELDALGRARGSGAAIGGHDEREQTLNPADRERTAYHESGHALLGLLVPGSDPVHRVTIVPRGMALGATYQLPTDDRTNYPRTISGRASSARSAGARPSSSATPSSRRAARTTSAGHRDRPPDGAALGNEREARPDQLRGLAGRRAPARLPAPTLQRGDRRADRRRGAAHRRGMPGASDPPAHRAPRQTGRARHRAPEGRVARRARDPGSHRPRPAPGARRRGVRTDPPAPP